MRRSGARFTEAALEICVIYKGLPAVLRSARSITSAVPYRFCTRFAAEAFNHSATESRSSPKRWPYTSRVIVADLWPNSDLNGVDVGSAGDGQAGSRTWNTGLQETRRLLGEGAGAHRPAGCAGRWKPRPTPAHHETPLTVRGQFGHVSMPSSMRRPGVPLHTRSRSVGECVREAERDDQRRIVELDHAGDAGGGCG